ncbi:MAG TPA: carboxypeptidase-like regulatory domain-containing protein, partial [Flavobacteriales bacterium]|nr:carboxypeptidase-like regulatory domain-containing protein [Flavobacteriales bacterium]
MMRSTVALCALAGALCSHAQDVVLKGKVTDEQSGEPLIGVNVTYAPGKGGATDVNGDYSFPVPTGPQTITYSFVGYVTVTRALDLPVAASVTNDVRMSPSAMQLDMVVISAGKFEQRVG